VIFLDIDLEFFVLSMEAIGIVAPQILIVLFLYIYV
jgi:hypothetical protein